MKEGSKNTLCKGTPCKGSNVGQKLAHLMNWERLVLLDQKKKLRAIREQDELEIYVIL